MGCKNNDYPREVDLPCLHSVLNGCCSWHVVVGVTSIVSSLSSAISSMELPMKYTALIHKQVGGGVMRTFSSH